MNSPQPAAAGSEPTFGGLGRAAEVASWSGDLSGAHASALRPRADDARPRPRNGPADSWRRPIRKFVHKFQIWKNRRSISPGPSPPRLLPPDVGWTRGGASRLQINALSVVARVSVGPSRSNENPPGAGGGFRGRRTRARPRSAWFVAVVALALALSISGLTATPAAGVSLNESTALIGAAQVRGEGIDGSGFVIAVVDIDGVDRTHPMLSGRIVAEACFAQGDCLGGIDMSTIFGSAKPPCDNCPHGTHIAGIAAAVAPGAKIIAIRVSGKPADTIEALQWLSGVNLTSLPGVGSNQQLAAVNVSQGSDETFTKPCVTDPIAVGYKAVADKLAAKGVATIAASGNEWPSPGLARPACVPGVVSVGNTGIDDRIDARSSSASFLSFLAPGEDIESAVPPGTPGGVPGPDGPTGSFSGTSYAAPHVAGAWALMRQKLQRDGEPNGVADVMSLLSLTGKPITDRRNGVTTPRLRIYQALFANPARARPRYAVTDLGTLGGEDSRAYGLNENGTVVGEAELLGFNTLRPFVHRDGRMRQLLPIRDPQGPDFPEDGGGAGLAVSDQDQVVGNTRVRDRVTATTWPLVDARGVALEVEGDRSQLVCGRDDTSCFARDVNEGGTLVGEVGDVGAFVRAPASRRATLLPGISFGTLPSVRAAAINERGDVAGTGTAGSGSGRRFLAVVWPRLSAGGGTRVPLDLEVGGQGQPSEATDINDEAAVVGYVGSRNSRLASRAFKTDPVKDSRAPTFGLLPTLPGSDCCAAATDINSPGICATSASPTAKVT